MREQPAGLVVLLAGCGADEKASLSGPLTYERGGGLAGRRAGWW